MKFLSALVLAMALPAAAEAKSVSVKFCTDLQVSFADASTGDWWTTASSVDARYIKSKITASDGTVVWNDYANSSGCTSTLTLSTLRSYKVVVSSEAVVSDNNQVVVYDDPTSPALYTWTATSSFKPSASGTKSYTWPISASGSAYASNVMAVGFRAIDNLDAGLSNELFPIFHDPCGAGSCMKLTTLDTSHTSWPSTYISDADRFGDRFKYVMAHEIGHMVGAMVDERRRTGGQDTSADDGSTSGLSTCASGGGHDMDSEEWQNSAANEGWAHFYAAAMWNDETGTDCHFWEWNPSDSAISCTADENWLVDSCYGGKTPPHHTGNTGDWLAFWWHLFADEGYSYDTLANVWDTADPGSWSSASGGFDVYDDLRDGALAAGIDMTAWDYWAEVSGVSY